MDTSSELPDRRRAGRRRRAALPSSAAAAGRPPPACRTRAPAASSVSGQRQRLGLHHRRLVGVVEVGPHGGRAGEAHGEPGVDSRARRSSRRPAASTISRRRARQPDDDRGAAVRETVTPRWGASTPLTARSPRRIPSTRGERGAHRPIADPGALAGHDHRQRVLPCPGKLRLDRATGLPGLRARQPPNRRPTAPCQRTARAPRGRARPRPKR